MRAFTWAAVALVVGSTALAACKDRREPERREVARTQEDAADAKRGVTEDHERLGEYTYADRDAFRAAKERELIDVDLRIGELEAQAQDAKGEAKVELDTAVEDLRQQRERLRGELERFGEVTEDEWESFRDSVDDAMEGLRDSLRGAWDRFKRTT